MVQGWLWAKRQVPMQKLTKAKRFSGIAQVADSPPSKCKALSSKPNNSPSKNPSLIDDVKRPFSFSSHPPSQSD